jgi:hypothetical protein
MRHISQDEKLFRQFSRLILLFNHGTCTFGAIVPLIITRSPCPAIHAVFSTIGGIRVRFLRCEIANLAGDYFRLIAFAQRGSQVVDDVAEPA